MERYSQDSWPEKWVFLRAERSLRPLVLKRKVSFGSKTQKGADVLSILLSVCFTLWWGKLGNFYVAYDATVRKWQAA